MGKLRMFTYVRRRQLAPMSAELVRVSTEVNRS